MAVGLALAVVGGGWVVGWILFARAPALRTVAIAEPRAAVDVVIAARDEQARLPRAADRALPTVVPRAAVDRGRRGVGRLHGHTRPRRARDRGRPEPAARGRHRDGLGPTPGRRRGIGL